MRAITVLQPNGRIVIPAEIRQELGIGAGQRLEVSIENDRIVLTPQISRLRQAQALVTELTADDDSLWSDQLIVQRRGEAERD